jgi:gliding motility-associated-like protein
MNIVYNKIAIVKKRNFMKTFFLIIFIPVFFYGKLQAQCCSVFNDQLNQIGSVNTYYPSPQNTTVSSGSTSLTLDAVPQIDQFGNSYGTIPISTGDLVLIIQMQGADFNSGNSNLYGSNVINAGPDGLGGTGYINSNNVGQYEFVIAQNDVPLSGGVLQINGSCTNGGLINSYVNSSATTISGQYTYQVIRVPRFNNLTLNQDINTTAWNGSVGGVLAFFVLGDLDLNGHTISAEGKGFRGGYQNVRPSGSNVTVYSTPDINQSSGKGEGICGTPRFLWNGQDQVDNGATWIGYPGGNYGRGAPGNAGGGGNTHNAGGGGGAGYGSGGVGGNGIAGSGTAAWPNGGRPGLGIIFNNERLIFGGGGGGGDANNAQTGVKGGAGGGIIFIKAGNVLGTGTLNASGTNGQVGVFGAAPDGAGGGGGGGCITLISESTTNSANIFLIANAGLGGNTLNDGSDPHGPGGGGGGGAIFYALQGAIVNSSVNGGNSGGSNNGNGTVHGASNGQPGIINTIDPTVISPNLSITINPFPVANFEVSDICKDEVYQFVDLSFAPATNGTIIQSWNWNFGDGTESSIQNPTHTYSLPGSYSVTLIISTNYGCSDTITQTVQVFSPISTSTTVSICDEYIWSENGQTYNTSGIYSANYSTIHGCDSTILLDLTIYPSLTSSVFGTICQGEQFEFNGAFYSNQGSFPVVLSTINGCDSTVTLNLTVNPIPQSPVLSASPVKCPGDPFTFSAENVDGHTINWSGPANFNSQNYSNTILLATENVGEYSATLNSLGCVSAPSSLIALIDYDQVIDDYIFPNVITPNNDGINDEIDINLLAQTCEPFELVIINRWGNLVYEGDQNAIPFNGTDIQGGQLNEGIYFYNLNFFYGEKHGFLHIVK